MLDLLYNVPGTLQDMGIGNYHQPAVNCASTVAAAALAAWAQCAPTQHEPPPALSSARTTSTFEPSISPFADNTANEVWAGRVLVDHDTLAQTDVLEADPPNFQTAIKNPRLQPFWYAGMNKEMQGLWDRGCLKRVQKSTLSKDAKIFGSRLHCKIKHNAKTGLVTECKVRLIVQGDRMKKGDNYEDSFAPVPRAAANRVFFSVCTAEDMNSEKIDFTQLFIQGSWKYLPKGEQPDIYIRPPRGVEEDEGIVY